MYQNPYLGYPYQQYSPNPYQQNMTSMPNMSYGHQNNNVKQVNGPQSALQYPVAPNTQSEPLFDVNGKVFYVVTADAAGSKTLEAFDFSPHVEENPVSIDGAKFVSKEEYDQFVAKVNAALEALNGVHAAVPTAAARYTADGTQGTDVDAEADDARRPFGAR